MLRRDGQGDAYSFPVMALKEKPRIDARGESRKGEAKDFNRSKTNTGSNESYNWRPNLWAR